jgi:CHAT domain
LRQELSATLEAQKDWKNHQARAQSFQHSMVHLEHAENNLLSLPWHIVPFNNRFLYLSKGFYTEGSLLPIFEPEKVLPLKILVVIAIPDDLEEKERLNHEREIEKIIEAFEPILADAQVEIDFANDGTLATLKEKLANNAYHILHFSGHGAYNEKNKTGELLMEDDKTFKKRRVSAKEFVEVLRLVPENCPELVLLSACESAKGFDSITEVLQKSGVTAVVSMNQRVLDYYATYFAAALYQNIVKHLKSREPLSHSFALAIEATQQEEARQQHKRGQYLIPQLFTSQHVQNLLDYQKPQSHALTYSAYKFVTGEKGMLLDFEKITDANRFPLFIFDNLESFQENEGGAFAQKHHDLRDLMTDIIAQGCPVILTSRYPVPDFPAVEAINLNEVSFGDFHRKAQILKFYELRHRLDTEGSMVQRRPTADGNDKADFRQVMELLHQTLGGNYRALEFFDHIYQTNSHAAYATLDKLDDFKQQLAQDAAQVRQDLRNADLMRDRLHSEAKALVFDNLIALWSPDELRTLQLLEPFRVPVLPEAVKMQDPLSKNPS